MKLIYISSSTLFSKSANSLHVMKMANSFSKEIKDVTLILRDVLRDESPFRFYDVKESFKLSDLKVNRYNKLAPFVYSLKILLKYLRVTRQKGVIFFGRDILSLSLLAIFSNNVSIEVHDIPISFFKKFILKKMVKNKKFKRVVVITEALKNDFINLTGIEEKKILTAHDGADVHSFSKLEDKNKIGYVGSVNKGRGIELIIELANIHLDKEFHIVGGSKSDLENRLGILTIPSNVICHGYLSQEEIKKVVEKFFIVLAPYQKKVEVSKKGVDTSKWMSPIKIFEYMSYGKAMIVSDLPVLKEVVKNNYNGLMAHPENISEWSNYIDELWNKEEKHYKLKNNAYSTLIENYTWDQRAKLILEEVRN